jgi:hypothetical protein
LLVRRSGQRVLSSRHYVNGELFVSIDSEWRRNNSIWVMESLRATTNTEGRQVVADLAVGHTAVQNRPAAPLAALANGGLEGLRAIGPRPAVAYELSCVVAGIMLFGAAGTLAFTVMSGGSAWMIAFAYINYTGNILNMAGSCEG